MLRKFADILAIAFHPAFMGVAVLLLFSAKRDDLPVSTWLTAIGLILIFALIIPVAGTYFLHKDIYLKVRGQRFRPLVITLVSHLILYFLLRQFYAAKPLMIGIILLTINLVVLLIFTSFIKASMHANAIAIVLCLFGLTYGIISALEAVPLIFYIIVLIVSILFTIIIWQRLVSKAHSVIEIICGFISGFISVGITLFYIDAVGY